MYFNSAISLLTASIRTLLLIGLFSGTACTGIRSDQQRDPMDSLVAAGEEYVHPETGIEFPPVIGPFVRMGVHSMDSEEKDIAASYALIDRGIDASVYIYIYPIEQARWNTPTPLKGHFKEVKSEVLAVHPDAKLLSDSDFTLDASRVGRKAVFLYPGSFRNKQELLESQAVLFRKGEWFIKYRVTFPERKSEKVEEPVQDLMMTVRWPDLT